MLKDVPPNSNLSQSLYFKNHNVPEYFFWPRISWRIDKRLIINRKKWQELISLRSIEFGWGSLWFYPKGRIQTKGLPALFDLLISTSCFNVIIWKQKRKAIFSLKCEHLNFSLSSFLSFFCGINLSHLMRGSPNSQTLNNVETKKSPYKNQVKQCTKVLKTFMNSASR